VRCIQWFEQHRRSCPSARGLATDQSHTGGRPVRWSLLTRLARQRTGRPTTLPGPLPSRQPRGVVRTTSSAAAAALSDSELSRLRIAAAGCCSALFGLLVDSRDHIAVLVIALRVGPPEEVVVTQPLRADRHVEVLERCKPLVERIQPP